MHRKRTTETNVQASPTYPEMVTSMYKAIHWYRPGTKAYDVAARFPQVYRCLWRKPKLNGSIRLYQYPRQQMPRRTCHHQCTRSQQQYLLCRYCNKRCNGYYSFTFTPKVVRTYILSTISQIQSILWINSWDCHKRRNAPSDNQPVIQAITSATMRICSRSGCNIMLSQCRYGNVLLLRNAHNTTSIKKTFPFF